ERAEVVGAGGEHGPRQYRGGHQYNDVHSIDPEESKSFHTNSFQGKTQHRPSRWRALPHSAWKYSSCDRGEIACAASTSFPPRNTRLTGITHAVMSAHVRLARVRAAPHISERKPSAARRRIVCSFSFAPRGASPRVAV